MEGFSTCEANFVPLTPISFLDRAAFVYGKNPSIIYGDVTYTWKETRDRCVKLAYALSVNIGVNRGKVVATFSPNTPAHYELHFGVPMAGAILSALNTSLDPPTLAATLQQLEPQVIFVDHQYLLTVSGALKLLSNEKTTSPSLVLIGGGKNHTVFLPKTLDYNDLLSLGKEDFKVMHPNDECDPISINFTSGSTGKPKGAIYSHRSAYLNSLSVIFRYDMKKMPTFLWTVDMFRCNGWCFPWAVAALGGTNVCLREVTAEVIFNSVAVHKVTHLCGPPTILDKIASSKTKDQWAVPTRVDVIVAGPLPSSEIISKVKKFGFDIHHGYGMTEALGPMTNIPLITRDKKENDKDENMKIRYREGTHNILTEDIDVKDPETMISVPSDGITIGEIMFRGNNVMLGYHKDLERTQNVFKGGWYMTGDLGVRNPDGDIEMKDRKLDSIITNGEVVSTIEIERVIRTHPFVKEVAVVGKTDNALGETPYAFVTLKDECFLSGKDVIEFCTENSLPGSMIPGNVCFGNLPKNSTGKVLKFILREKAQGILYSNGH